MAYSASLEKQLAKGRILGLRDLDRIGGSRGKQDGRKIHNKKTAQQLPYLRKLRR
jgi:hypothetical protein